MNKLHSTFPSSSLFAVVYMVIIGANSMSYAATPVAPAMAISNLMADGQYMRAMEQLSRISPVDRSQQDIYDLAVCFRQLQRYGEAQAMLDGLTGVWLDRLDVLLLRVDIDYAQEDWLTAAARLEEAAARYGGEPDFVLRYAQVHHALGNEAGADAAFTYYGQLRQQSEQGVTQ